MRGLVEFAVHDGDNLTYTRGRKNPGKQSSHQGRVVQSSAMYEVRWGKQSRGDFEACLGIRYGDIDCSKVREDCPKKFELVLEPSRNNSWCFREVEPAHKLKSNAEYEDLPRLHEDTEHRGLLDMTLMCARRTETPWKAHRGIHSDTH